MQKAGSARAGSQRKAPSIVAGKLGLDQLKSYHGPKLPYEPCNASCS